MKAILLAIAAKLLALSFGAPITLPPQHELSVRSNGAAEDVVAVVQEATELTPAEQEQWARVLYVWSFYESAWRANPPGFNDDGHACGVMQTWAPHKIVEGATCSKVRADRRLGYRVGFTLMRQKFTECGSMQSALVAFSMYGSCPKPGTTIQLVQHRCKLAGLGKRCDGS